MTRRVCLIALFVVGLVTALLATVPLGFVLDRSGAGQTGLRWSAVQGTIWKGQISGLAYGAQPIGDVSLSARPGALLGGQLSYDIGFSGPAGRGGGVLNFGLGNAELSQFAGQILISELVSLAPDVRRLGGRVELTVDTLRIRGRGCTEAEGGIATDALSQAAIAYGRQVSTLSGQMTCDAGMLDLPMRAQSSAGEEMQARLRLGLVEPSRAEARVITDDIELGNVLVLLGFGVDGADYVYRKDVDLGGSL